MGQALSKRIISRRAGGTLEGSCDLSTGVARRLGLPPVPLSSQSWATDRVIGVRKSDARATPPSTFVRMPSDHRVPGILF